MVDNNLRNQAYDDSYRGSGDYPNTENTYDRPEDQVYSRRYHEPGIDESVNYSTGKTPIDRPYNSQMRNDLDHPADYQTANPTEVANTRGLTRRNRYPDERPVGAYPQNDIQEVHRSNNIAIGLLLGVLLTSIIGILAAIFYFATTEPQPTSAPITAPNAAEPAPTEPEASPAQP